MSASSDTGSSMRRFLTSASGLQISVCALGCIASLVPWISTTGTVWGWDPNPFHSNPQPPVIIDRVQPGSPLAVAGILANDRVLAIDGRPIEDTNDWYPALEKLKPGAVVNLEIRRGEEELTLQLAALRPQTAGVVLHTWQVVASLTFLFLGILLVVTHAVRPSPVWRPLVVLLVGLALLFMICLLVRHESWLYVWQRWAIFDWPYVGLEATLSGMAALALFVMGLRELRAVLAPGAPSRDDLPRVPSEPNETITASHELNGYSRCRRPARWNVASVFMPLFGFFGGVLMTLFGPDIPWLGADRWGVMRGLTTWCAFCVYGLIATGIAYVRSERLWGLTVIGFLLNAPLPGFVLMAMLGY